MQSRITLSADKEENISRLKDSFYNAPYKLVHYGNKLFHEHLELIIMCSSPGVMDGDHLDMEIQINENAEVKLFTQSFNKLHPMKTGASQNLNIHIQKGAIFQYVPHPITPFVDAKFDTINQINMDVDSTLIFGDIYTSGRVHSGESFEFTHIHSQTEIKRGEKLIYKDNILMEPKNQPIKKNLFWAGYTHHATLIYVSPAADSIIEELNEILTEENIQELDFGFSQFSQNGIIIRALSHSGEKLYDWLKVLSDMCWQFTSHYLSEQNEKQLQEAEIEEEKVPSALPNVQRNRKTLKSNSGTKKVKATISKKKKNENTENKRKITAPKNTKKINSQ